MVRILWPVKKRKVFCRVRIATSILVTVPTNKKKSRISFGPTVSRTYYHTTTEQYEKQTKEQIGSLSILNWTLGEFIREFAVVDLKESKHGNITSF